MHLTSLRCPVFSIVLAFSTLLTATATAEPVNPQARECVGYLLQLEEEKDPQTSEVVATAKYVGTVFAATYAYESATKQFMVTARHVVVDEHGHPRTDLLAQFLHEKTGSIRTFGLQPEKWLFHREAERIDLAVYPALPSRIRARGVQSDIWIADEVLQRENIAEGDEVFYTGLLLHYPGRAIPITEANRTVVGLVQDLSPITRFGRLALVEDDVLVEGKSLYFSRR